MPDIKHLIHKLKEEGRTEDTLVISALAADGWNIERTPEGYIWIRYDPKEEDGPCADDDEIIDYARRIHAREKKAVDTAETADNSVTEGELHRREADEIDLRDKLIKFLESEGLKYWLNVECRAGAVEVVTEGAVYAFKCSLSSASLAEPANELAACWRELTLSDKVELSDDAGAIIVVCCARGLDDLKYDAVENYAVEVKTLEEVTASLLHKPATEEAAPASGTLFPSTQVSSAARVQQMRPSLITRHPSLLMRAGGLDEEHVMQLEEAYRAGRTLPPVDVFYDGQIYLLAEGNHRHEGATRADCFVDITLHSGGFREAFIFALKANADHGLKLNRDDKRHKAVAMLVDKELFRESDSVLSTYTSGSLTQQFISSVRRDLAKLTHAMIEDPEGELSDEDYARVLDIPEGLVRIVRGLPSEEREQLTLNVLSDDGRRLGADGVLRSAPTRVAEAEAPLFPDDHEAQPKLPQDLADKGWELRTHDNNGKFKQPVFYCVQEQFSLNTGNWTTPKEAFETARELQERREARLAADTAERNERYEQARAEHYQLLEDERTRIMRIDSLEELAMARDGVRARGRALDKLGVSPDDPTDWNAELWRAQMDAIIAREYQLKDRQRVGGEAAPSVYQDSTYAGEENASELAKATEKEQRERWLAIQDVENQIEVARSLNKPNKTRLEALDADLRKLRAEYDGTWREYADAFGEGQTRAARASVEADESGSSPTAAETIHALHTGDEKTVERAEHHLSKRAKDESALMLAALDAAGERLAVRAEGRGATKALLIYLVEREFEYIAAFEGIDAIARRRGLTFEATEGHEALKEILPRLSVGELIGLLVEVHFRSDYSVEGNDAKRLLSMYSVDFEKIKGQVTAKVIKAKEKAAVIRTPKDLIAAFERAESDAELNRLVKEHYNAERKPHIQNQIDDALLRARLRVFKRDDDAYIPATLPAEIEVPLASLEGRTGLKGAMAKAVDPGLGSQHFVIERTFKYEGRLFCACAQGWSSDGRIDVHANEIIPLAKFAGRVFGPEELRALSHKEESSVSVGVAALYQGKGYVIVGAHVEFFAIEPREEDEPEAEEQAQQKKPAGSRLQDKRARIDEALRVALDMKPYSAEAWAKLRETGASDDDISHKLVDQWGNGIGRSKGIQFACKGLPEPAFWIDCSTHLTSAKPTLKGDKLIERVRALLGIPTDFQDAHAQALTEWLRDVRTVGALERFIEHRELRDEARDKGFDESDRLKVVAAVEARRAEIMAAGGAIPPNTNPSWDEPGMMLVPLPEGLEALVVKESSAGVGDGEHFEFYGPCSPTGYHSDFGDGNRTVTPRHYAEKRALELHTEYLKILTKEEKLRKKGKEVRGPAIPLEQNTLRAYFDKEVAESQDPETRQFASEDLIENFLALKPEWATQISGDSKPHAGTNEQVRTALHSALHHVQNAKKRWDGLRKSGATDAELKSAIANEFGYGGGASGGSGTLAYKGGANPRFWYGQITDQGEPTLKGQALIDAVRDLLQIPQKKEAAKGSASKKSKSTKSRKSEAVA